MSLDLALYNVHKRQTLDRLSGKYSFRAREILRKATSSEVKSLEDSIKRGATFDPDTKLLRRNLTEIFTDHQHDVIHVAISDGIQEVSPENKLHAWADHPMDMPIELTLGAELAGRRDKVVEEFIRRRSLIDSVSKFVTDVVDEYLRNIRKAYTRAAFDWLDPDNDESPSIDDVIEMLKTSLQKTDSYAKGVFRTETTNYFNESRHEYFQTNTAVDYMQLYAVTDGRISKICEDRHGFVVTIQQAKVKRYLPAFHPNCRTIQRPLISSLKSDMAIIEKGLAMNESSFTPLPRGWG